MELRWPLLIIGLAIGVALIILGTLVIFHGSTVGLLIGIETGEYALLPPDREAIVAGVLMTVLGTIAVSVSLASIIVFWKRNS